MSYAKNTIVSIDQSQMEIQKLLQRYGATQFAIDWEKAQILFKLQTRSVRIQVQYPLKSAFEYTPTHIKRQPDQLKKAFDQACRQRWRALVLVLKAKLEAIESEITTLDHEFLSFFVLKNGQTVAENIIPQLQQPGILPLLPGE
jgi:hypothetical protein